MANGTELKPIPTPERGGVKHKFWIISGVVVLALVFIYIFQACALVQSGQGVSGEDVVGQVYQTGDNSSYVSFLEPTKCYYYGDEEGHEATYTVNDGYIALDDVSDSKSWSLSFVSISGDKLFCPKLNSMFYLVA